MFPDFSLNHVLVYRCLWRIEPITGENVIKETRLSRSATFRILAELVAAGLAKKTNFKPIGYYAENPLKTYYSLAQRVSAKLKKGNGQLKRILDNSSGLSNEKYLLKLDGGQTRLIGVESHKTSNDEDTIRTYRNALDKKLVEIERGKLKAWQLVGR